MYSGPTWVRFSGLFQQALGHGLHCLQCTNMCLCVCVCVCVCVCDTNQIYFSGEVGDMVISHEVICVCTAYTDLPPQRSRHTSLSHRLCSPVVVLFSVPSSLGLSTLCCLHQNLMADPVCMRTCA